MITKRRNFCSKKPKFAQLPKGSALRPPPVKHNLAERAIVAKELLEALPPSLPPFQYSCGRQDLLLLRLTQLI